MMKKASPYLGPFTMALIMHILLVVVMLLAWGFLSENPSTQTALMETGWRYLLALVPVIPIAFAVYFLIRAVEKLDELQRRIQLEAFAVSLCGTGLLTFSSGYLELAGLPHINPIFILPLMALLWGIGMAIAGRRYR